MKNYIRYGVHKKKPLLKDAEKTFDGIVVPGNILLYQYKATPGAVVYLKKPFFVDPMSYLFGEDYDVFKRRVESKNETRFKPSFEKLLEGHGLNPDVILKLDHDELRKEFIRNRKRLIQFVNSCLVFQQDMVEKAIRDAAEIDLALGQISKDLLVPQFLIPPYFRLELDNFDESLALTRQILEESVKLSKPERLRPLVYLNKATLKDKTRVAELFPVFKAYPFDGYVLWIDDFNEYKDASRDTIVALSGLVRQLSADHKSIDLLHGGYFGMLLKHFGATSICHGLGFGEVRSGVATARGGGPPPVRYYLRDLHTFLTLPKALEVLRANREMICDCPVCRRVMGNDPEGVLKYEGEDDLADLHYLYVRNQEKRFVNENTLAEALQNLDVTLTMYESVDTLRRQVTDKKGKTHAEPIISSAYLRIWKDALEESATLYS